MIETFVERVIARPLSHLGSRLDPLSHRLEGTRLRRILEVALFPALLALTYLAGTALVANGITVRTIAGTMLLYIVLGLVFAPMERLMPWSRRWTSDPEGSSTDLLIFLSSRLFRLAIGVPLKLATIVLLVRELQPIIGQGFWPREWPMLAQVILLIYAHDFLRYWFHRACHEWPLLWRIHAIHHSPSRLYWFNATRSHPLEPLLQAFYWAIPLAFLGAPLETIFVAGLVGRTIGCFQHGNLDVKLGPLDHVFSSPHNHRFHHSKRIEEGNSNYGSDIILWDQLFGTFHHPRGVTPSDDIGLENQPAFPRKWWRLMLAPFVWTPKRWGPVAARETVTPAETRSEASAAARIAA